MKKYPKIPAISLIGFFALACAPSIQADWQLLNSFSNAEELNDWQLYNTLAEGNAFMQIVARPFDDAGGNALAISAGNVPFNHANVWRALPQPVSDLTTLYMEVAIADSLGDYAFGLKRNAADAIVQVQEDESVVISQWPDYAAVARIGRAGQDAYNNNGYSDDFAENRVSTWYKYWMVIDHFNLSYSIYLQGGEFAEQTLVASDFIYRTQEFDDLLTLMVLAHAGSSTALYSAEPIYLANIQMDYSGSNLSTPTVALQPTTWADYALNSDGRTVDTGSFMGWLDVANKPFVYSFQLERYVYLPEDNVNDDGSWIYLFK